MRNDMNKVLVERPRLRYGDWLRGGRESGFRQFLNDEARAPKIGIRAGHQNRKHLNENLAPLRRFMMSCVGRRWDLVMSELHAGVDVRNTVQAHILLHIKDFVREDVRVRPRVDGKGRSRGVIFEAKRKWSGEWVDVREGYAPLFVDPRTGLLCRPESEMHRAENERNIEARKAADEFAHTRKLADGRFARIFEGVWYEVTMTTLPGARLRDWEKRSMKPEQKAKLPRMYDVLKRVWVSRLTADEYVTAKVQMGKKDLKRLPMKLGM